MPGGILGRDGRGGRELSTDLLGGLPYSARPSRDVRTGRKARGHAGPGAVGRVRVERSRRSQPRSLASRSERGGPNQSSPRRESGGNGATPPPRSGTRSVRCAMLHSARSLSMAAAVKFAAGETPWTAAGAGPFGTCPRDLLRLSRDSPRFSDSALTPIQRFLDCCGCRPLRDLSPRLA